MTMRLIMSSMGAALSLTAVMLVVGEIRRWRGKKAPMPKKYKEMKSEPGLEVNGE